MSSGIPGISDASLALLERWPNLENLSLVGTDISLVGTDISDAALKNCIKLKRLRELDLRRTGVTDACIYTVVQLPSLGKLLLNDTRVTPNGIQRLRDSLPDCEIPTGP